VIASSITASDEDSTVLAGATVWISGNYKADQDVLAFVGTAAITAAW